MSSVENDKDDESSGGALNRTLTYGEETSENESLLRFVERIDRRLSILERKDHQSRRKEKTDNTHTERLLPEDILQRPGLRRLQ